MENLPVMRVIGSSTYSMKFRPGDGSPTWTVVNGSPNNVVSALGGSLIVDSNTGTIYTKGATSGNTTWIAQSGGGGAPSVGPAIAAGMPGYFPNVSFPLARVLGSAANTHNDMYTVPAGRTAIIQDLMVTNPTANTISYSPGFSNTTSYYQYSPSAPESAAGIGHNYGVSQNSRTPAIVLRAGETFSVYVSDAGLSMFASVIEFDNTAPYARADITSFVAGNNTLFTMPSGKTISVGIPSWSSINNPVSTMSGVSYFNGSGGSRTLTGTYLVPSGSSPTPNNQIGGTNTIFNGGCFNKYFYGNFAAGDTLVMVVDANTAGQYAFMNYALF